jgi:hypothetical protein
MSIEEPLFVASRRKGFGLFPLATQVIALIVAGYTSGRALRDLASASTSSNSTA